MKKIVLVSAAMGGAALVAFGASGTFAAYSDSTTQQALAGAGTLTVSTSQTSAAADGSEVSTVPGGTSYTSYYVMNDLTSDSAGFASGYITVDSENENGCLRPEIAVGDTTCAAGGDQGEFGGQALVTTYAAVTSRDACNTSIRNNPGTLGTLNSGTRQNGAAELQPGAGVCVVLAISLPASVSNNVQGDSTSYTFTATLDQFQQGAAA